MQATVTETLVQEQCETCGIVYAVPDWFLKRRKGNSEYWYCPNGHQWRYSESEADKVRKQLAEMERRKGYVEADLERSRERNHHLDRRLSAAKGVVTKMKKRAAGGACQCCNRYFANLHRHMKSKHPEFVEADSESNQEGESQ